MELLRQKNQATYIVFPIIDNDGDAVSAAAGLDSETDQWNDGAAPTGFADCTNEATEVGSTGIYYLSLTAAEMNYDYIYIQIKTTTTDAKTQHILIRTMTGDPLLIATTSAGALVWSVGTRAITDKTNFQIASAGFPVGGFASGAITADAIAANAIGSSEFAQAAADKVWDTTTKALTTPNDYKATGFSTHAAADVWTVVTRALTDKAGFTISGTTQTFDALDTLLDAAHGAGSWLTATGFSTHNAAAVWAVGTRALTDKAGFTISGTLQTFDALENISTTQVNAEVDQALVDIDLDHLIQVAAGVETPTVDSYLDQVMNKAGTQDFDPTTDSLEAIRDRGDAEWDTAVGFSTHVAADIWTAGSRALSTPNDYKATGFSTHSAANVWAVGTRDITGGTVDTATSVTNDVGITQAGADKVWSTATRSLTDKAGFTISGTLQTLDALENISTSQVNAEVDNAIVTYGLDHLVSAAVIGTDIVDNSIIAKLASSAATADWDTFVNTDDSLEAIRDRGDAAWTTGGAGGLDAIINVIPSIPKNIDLSNTKTVRIGLYIIDSIDDLPTTAEITPGTITIDRSADGGTSWSTIVNAAACSEHAGAVYYDEVFDSGSGYASADMIRIIFKGQKVTIAANDFEIADASDGMVFITRMDSGLSGGGPSAGDIADAVWDEPIADHTNSAQFGGKNQLVVPSETLADYKATGFSTHAAADIWAVGTRALTDKAGFTISGTTQTFDALDTLLDAAHGAGSWLSAVGYSTHAAADIWTVVTRALTDKAGFTISGTKQTFDALNDITAAAVWAVGTRALTTPNDYKADVSALATTATLNTHDGKLDTVDGIVDAILVDTGTTLPAEVLRLRGLNGEFIVAEYTFVGDDNTVIEYWQYDTLSNFNTHDKSTGLIGSWILNSTFVSSKPTIIKSKRLT